MFQEVAETESDEEEPSSEAKPSQLQKTPAKSVLDKLVSSFN